MTWKEANGPTVPLLREKALAHDLWVWVWRERVGRRLVINLLGLMLFSKPPSLSCKPVTGYPTLDNRRASERHVVLVVEDEPLLRIDAVDMIENAGFTTVEAGDATEAVAILEKRLDIRIVFSDIDMPRGLDGMKLAALVRDRWPPIEIILTSGYRTPLESELPPRSLFFAKPYKEIQVIAAMRRFVATGEVKLAP